MLFTLGIRELNNKLQLLSSPGLYELNCAVRADALQLTMQMLMQVPKLSPGDLLLCPPELLPDLKEAAARFKLQLPVPVTGFNASPADSTAYWQLLYEYLQRRRHRHCFVILLRPSPERTEVNANELQTIMLQLQRWCRAQAYSCVLFNYGPLTADGLRLQQVLEPHLMGKMTLLPDGAQHQLQIEFWRTPHQFHALQYYTLTTDAAGFFQAVKTQALLEQFGDDELLFTNSARIVPVFEEALSCSAVKDLAELYTCGLRHGSCFLVFEISHESEVLTAARYIYQLRRQNGNQLKIIVALHQLRLRSHTEQILLKSGANLLFEAAAGLGYIRDLVLNLHHAVYSGELPADFKLIESALKLVTVTPNLLQPQSFAAVVRSVSRSYGSFFHDGALLRLIPRPDLTLKQSFTQYRPTRRGDLGTALTDCAYIYLLGVHAHNLEMVLSHVFAIAPQDLFSAVEPITDAAEISAALHHLTTGKAPAWLALLVERSSAAQESRQAARHQRTQLRLLQEPHWVKLR